MHNAERFYSCPFYGKKGSGRYSNRVLQSLGALLELAELVTALEHELVRARHLARGGGRARAQLLQRLAAAGDVLRDRSVRLQPTALTDYKTK